MELYAHTLSLEYSMQNKSIKQDKTEFFEKIINICTDLGAYRSNVIEAKKIETDRAFRNMCASNACGMYGRCYMCPPDVGDIDVLMERNEFFVSVGNVIFARRKIVLIHFFAFEIGYDFIYAHQR